METAFYNFLAPIIPDDIYTAEWKPHPTDPCRILGTWAEDSSPYEITCPPQLRSCIIVLQNILPQILELIESRLQGGCDGN